MIETIDTTVTATSSIVRNESQQLRAKSDEKGSCCAGNGGGNNNSGKSVSRSTRISAISGWQVQYLLYKLQRAAPYLPQSLPRMQFENDGHPSLSSGKHIAQVESIVAHMKHYGMLDTCILNEWSHDNEGTAQDKPQQQQLVHFVEFGCGTAKLSDHVSLQLPTSRQSACRFILIDKQTLSANRTRDGAIRARGTESVHRVTQDICTVSLQSLLESLSPLKQPLGHGVPTMVAMSKHLCGAAVEYTMQCLEDYYNHSSTMAMKAEPTTAVHPRKPWIPLAVATCCHYGCERDSSYRQAVHFWTQLGLTERDWHALVTVSQWASLKNNIENNTNKDDSLGMTDTVEETVDKTAPMTAANRVFPPPLPVVPLSCDVPANVSSSFIDSDHFERSFSRTAKQALGVQCKRVLDTARAHRLLAMGYGRVDLVAYTALSVEQHLLLAVPAAPGSTTAL
jgi:Methyltransferase TRM13